MQELRYSKTLEFDQELGVSARLLTFMAAPFRIKSVPAKEFDFLALRLERLIFGARF